MIERDWSGWVIAVLGNTNFVGKKRELHRSGDYVPPGSPIDKGVSLKPAFKFLDMIMPIPGPNGGIGYMSHVQVVPMFQFGCDVCVDNVRADALIHFDELDESDLRAMKKMVEDAERLQLEQRAKRGGLALPGTGTRQ